MQIYQSKQCIAAHIYKIIPILFEGDVDRFLGMYAKMEYMICSRFHAMILSTVARQKMYVLSYSKKINNVIEDLELNLPIDHFDDVDPDKTLSLDELAEKGYMI